MTDITRSTVEDFLYKEARLLDDRDFNEWLECYDEDAEYWMPAWDVDGKPTEDPQSEVSLMYYANRGGLEDRVFRIKTDRSSATSLPEPRHGHHITNVEILEQNGSEVQVRYNWITMYFRYNNVDPYYGVTHLTIDFGGAEPKIKKKKIILKNDYIHHVIDIYHV